MSKARGESNPQTRYGHRKQSPQGGCASGGICDRKETMTSGQRKQPLEIKCERCGTPSLWKGGRRKRFCSPTCAHGHRNGNKPRQPVEPGSLQQRQTKRSRALKIARGNCVDCQMVITEHNVYCIDWDHRNPNEKAFTIAYVIGRMAWDKIEKEIQKCDAVCRNCHALRTHHGKHWESKPNPTKINRGKQWRTAKPPQPTEQQDNNS